MTRVLPVVEGDGDVAAVPELVRRILHMAHRFDVTVLRPHKRGDLPRVRSRFEDFLRTAALEGAPVLWVLDYDCPTCDNHDRDLVGLQQWARTTVPATKVEFVFMVQEFETIFLADESTTRLAFPDIPPELTFPPNPELIRDAKGWLTTSRPKGLAYKPTQHQARLAAQVDLAVLRRRSPSFVRFESAVHRLVAVE